MEKPNRELPKNDDESFILVDKATGSVTPVRSATDEQLDFGIDNFRQQLELTQQSYQRNVAQFTIMMNTALAHVSKLSKGVAAMEFERDRRKRSIVIARVIP